MSSFHIRHTADSPWASVAPGIFLRDLGIAALCGDAWSLQIVRLEGEGARVEDMHRHEEGFSLAYVLRGWLDVEFAQLGLTRLATGAVIPAFNGPMHRERACGDGLELLLLVTQRRVGAGSAQHIVVQQAREAAYVPAADGASSVRDFHLDGYTAGKLRACARRSLAGTAPAAWQDGAQAHALLYLMAGDAEFEAEDGDRVVLRAGDLLHVAPGSRYRAVSRSDDALAIEMHLPG